MNYFFDSSALVKRYVAEPGTEVVLSLVGRAELCLASRFTWLEVLSAVVRVFKEGTLSNARGVIRALDEDFHALLGIVEITPALMAEARRLTIQHALRAADSVQLSSALSARAIHSADIRFVCADQRLNEAAASEGLAVLNPANDAAE